MNFNMEKELNKERCEKCKFILETEYFDEKDNRINFCRRLPPTVVVLRDSVIFKLPEVLLDGWCGEFINKDKLQAFVAK